VGYAIAEYGVSERRACKLLEMDRSSYRYEPQPDRNGALREQLIRLARQKPRYGYRRLGVLLDRSGQRVNHKRLYRGTCQESCV
jgi:putative transposase